MHDSETNLTLQEARVVQFVVDGLSNREIGARLGITEATIKAHVSSALRKTATTNRAELAVWAVTTGCFRPSR